jgi:SAM-dependent methyltransferase/TusA-related sulfurtransferase
VVAILSRQREAIADAVRAMYTAVAVEPEQGFHFPVGRAACEYVGYPAHVLDQLPPSAVESFAGVGYPFAAGVVQPGDTVLDIGSGSGTDSILACRLVGPTGIVYALDLTAAMRDKLRLTAARAGATNLRILEGDAEASPLDNESVSAVTSNGVINLVPDKRRAVMEIARVLRPGGRLQIADILLATPVGDACRSDPQMWAECVVGATTEGDFISLLEDAGLVVEVLSHLDYFAASSSAETRKVAACFGAQTAVLRARKPSAPKVVDVRSSDARGLSDPTISDVFVQTEHHPGAQRLVDVGDLGCGDVTLVVRRELETVEPGAVLALRSRVEAVGVELPAWCRMAGHQFIRTESEPEAKVHYIRKKTS